MKKKHSRTIFIPYERRDLSHLTIVKLHTLVHFISEILLTTHKKNTYIFNNFLQTFSRTNNLSWHFYDGNNIFRANAFQWILSKQQFYIKFLNRYPLSASDCRTFYLIEAISNFYLIVMVRNVCNPTMSLKSYRCSFRSFNVKDCFRTHLEDFFLKKNLKSPEFEKKKSQCHFNLI